ncbi:hypothetical protein WR25_18684 [Diploscapter pachys]|uniref:Uncharacterized protein n=1 Tax=Diploscapter pachys TaxID=2018661 RepID=A0A2A2JAF0_9BILA|nr:hypothetical protein WR25_18684 [Diploscapter pachys]
MEDDDEMMEEALIEDELEEQAQVTYVDEYGNVIDDGEDETIVEIDDFRGFRKRNGGDKAQRRIQGGGNLGGRLGRAKPAQQRITYTTEAAPSVFNRLSLA